MSDQNRPSESPDAIGIPQGTPPGPASGSESLRAELGSLSAMLPRVRGGSGGDILPSVQAALGSAFELERELGGGGMSRVFVATETALDRRVAVKVLSPELMQGVSAERFAREVALAARLQDPHIVPVLTTGATAEGLPFYTMPFIEGESLRERMKRGPVPLDEALRILRDVAEALEYAHGRGIVHRDIKPENVLLSGRNALVADFGIAKAVSAARASTAVPNGTLTSIGMSLGTPAYMAPEQAAGDAVDHQADLYAWGMMAWELLAGRHPFAGRTAAQLMAAQIGELPRALDEVRPGLPPALGALVMQCVAKTPSARPADAAAVLAALGGSTTDYGSTTGRRAPVAFAGGSGRRTTMIAAAVLVLALGGGGAWYAARGSTAAAATASAAPSLAVLPFEHQGDSSDVYLTEGITDEVRNKLAGVQNLVVIARASSNQYRGSKTAPQEIAKELGVRWLLTGTVRVVGSGDERRVLVRPELVEVMPDGRLQSRGGQPFDGPLTDVLRAQSGLATQVVRSMEVAVGGADQSRLTAVPTRDAEAYDQYLRGLAAMDGGSNPNVRTLKAALPHFERAVARDSGLVDAWRAIGNAYSLLYYLETPSPEYERRARASLAQIERVAPQSASFFRLRSLIRTRFEGDAEGSFADQQQAYRLDPNDPRILGALGAREYVLGRFDEALRRYDGAILRDPRLPTLHASRALILIRLRRFDEARAGLARARALAPASLAVFSEQLSGELAVGDLSGARRLLGEATADIPRDRLLAFVSLYGDRWWLFDQADTKRLLELPASAFDAADGYHAVRAEVLHHIGERERSRAHADSAVRLFDQLVKDAPRDAQSHVIRGLMLAYTGRANEAMAAVARGLELGREPSSSEVSGDLAYFHSVAARAAMLIGDRTRAIQWIQACLSARTSLTAAYLRLDPAFASLLGDPEFERVLKEAP